MRVLIVEDEPYLAEAIRDGLRLEAIAANSGRLATSPRAQRGPQQPQAPLQHIGLFLIADALHRPPPAG